MCDKILQPTAEDIPEIKRMEVFLSTVKGSSFNICAELYNIILASNDKLCYTLFEEAINLYEDIDSDDTVEIADSSYAKYEKNLEEQYGEIVNSFINFFSNQKLEEKVFYKNMWDSIQNDVFFPTESAKVFAFYYVVIDKRVPYFKLEEGYMMSNESYRKLRKKYIYSLKKIRYILNAEFEQKTERASLLLQELGIMQPSEEDGVERVSQYERSLMQMVAIINERKNSAPFIRNP